MLRACLAALLCASTAATTPAGVSIPCDKQNNLTGNGHVNYNSMAINHTECWDIACDTEVVLRFSVIDPYFGMAVYVYSSEDDTNFNLEYYWPRSVNTTRFIGVDLVMNSSALVQFNSVYSSGGVGTIAFDYVCVNATQAPPTPVPSTPSAPAGVSIPCDKQNNLTGTGHVQYKSMAVDHTECWDIACDTKAVLRFSVIDPYWEMAVYVYSSEDDTHFNLEYYWPRSVNTTRFIGVDLVMNGSALVQFNSVYSSGGLGNIAFDYVCVNATQAPPTAVPPTTPASVS